MPKAPACPRHKGRQHDQDLSDRGGASWAAIASLVETCKLNGVEPRAYFTDPLTRLVNGWPQARIGELMPRAYAKPGCMNAELQSPDLGSMPFEVPCSRPLRA